MKINLINHSEEDSWIPVSDMMAGLMMVFLLISIIYIINYEKKVDKIQQSQDTICSELRSQYKDKKDIWHLSICEDGLLVSFHNDSIFDQGRSELKKEFKIILSEFYPPLMETVMKYTDDISELRIEGHTSSEYYNYSAELSYIKNTELSQKRSLNVMDYVFSVVQNNDDYSQWMMKNLTAHGLSSSKLKNKKSIDEEDKEEDKVKSRRVDFRIQTNVQDKLIKEFQER